MRTLGALENRACRFRELASARALSAAAAPAHQLGLLLVVSILCAFVGATATSCYVRAVVEHRGCVNE